MLHRFEIFSAPGTIAHCFIRLPRGFSLAIIMIIIIIIIIITIIVIIIIVIIIIIIIIIIIMLKIINLPKFFTP